MTPPDNAHRAEFSVRCACGIEYHTSDEHAGRFIPCKCGRTVQLIRPANTAPPEEPTRRRKRKTRRTGGAAYNHSYNASSGETARAANLNWQRRSWNVMSVFEAFVRPIRRGTWPVRITAAIGWTYLVAAFAAWMLLIYTSEHLIFGTVIAYGPRWLALLPLVLLVPAALILARTALLPLALGAFIVAVPIMGARVSPSTLFAGAPPATPAAGTFRVATFNTRGGRGLAVDLVPFFELYKPDVVMFQECGDVLWGALQKQSAWHSARHGTLCTASQWPMGDYETMPRDELAAISERGFGGTGLVMRVRYGSPNGPLDVVNLHLETARRGLEGMLSPQGLVPDNPLGGSGTTDGEESAADQENEERFEMNAAIRDRESNLASRWAVDANSPAPMIIAGDFNMPVESTIYRRYWARFNDAFEERGNGLGWTKVEGRWLRIRIDHMLTTDGGPKPQRVRIGANFLSDHLPVIVDYAWPTR